MTDIILIIVLIGIVGIALCYIIKAQKNGVRCIGCSAGSTCAQKCSGNCVGCGGNCADK